MNAEVVSVGTELLLGQITDTNAVSLAIALAELGIGCTRRHTVGDNLDRVADVIREALSRAEVVVTIGGLGPTEDDLTRDAIAAAVGATMVLDKEVEDEIRAKFAGRGFTWLSSQSRQAMRPEFARPVPNPNGTAPGLICEKDGKIVIAMPGPRGEFVPMLDQQVRPYLAGISGGGRIVSRVLRVCGIGESMVEEKVRELLHAENPTVAPLAHLGEVHLRITARADTDAEIAKMLDETEAGLRAILGDAVFGTDATTLEAAVVDLLRERAQTVAVAESCTGGLLGGRLTGVSGSSDVFVGGFITYSNEMKTKMLGVPVDLQEGYGAVSEECARAMVEGARRETGSHWSISITGVAGPTGGTQEKPVGLVYIGLADKTCTKVVRNVFLGGREDVRRRSTQTALTLLRRAILEGGCASL